MYQQLRYWKVPANLDIDVFPLVNRRDLQFIRRAKRMLKAKEIAGWNLHPHQNHVEVSHPSLVDPLSHIWPFLDLFSFSESGWGRLETGQEVD